MKYLTVLFIGLMLTGCQDTNRYHLIKIYNGSMSSVAEYVLGKDQCELLNAKVLDNKGLCILVSV